MSFIFPGTGSLDYGYGSFSGSWFMPSGFLPSELLNNPWVIFGLFFALFFAVSFYSLCKTLKGSRAPPAIISTVLAFFMAAGIQGVWPQFSKIIITVSLVLFAVILLLLLFGKGKNIFSGLLIILSFLLFLWPIWSNLVSPYFLASLPTGMVYFLDTKSWIGFWVFVAGMVFLLISGKGGKEN